MAIYTTVKLPSVSKSKFLIIDADFTDSFKSTLYFYFLKNKCTFLKSKYSHTLIPPEQFDIHTYLPTYPTSLLNQDSSTYNYHPQFKISYPILKKYDHSG